MSEVLSADEIMARALGTNVGVKIDFEADIAEQDRQRRLSEGGQKQDGELPMLDPVDAATMRGSGGKGPHYVTVEYEVQKYNARGEVERDADGEAIWVTKTRRLKVGPFMIGVLPDATAQYAELSPMTKIVTFAWAEQMGEGDLNESAVIETFRSMVPPERRGLVDEAHVIAAVNAGSMEGVDTLEADALVKMVHLACSRYDEALDPEFLARNMDYNQLIKAVGKILFLNGPMKQRFLGQSGANQR